MCSFTAVWWKALRFSTLRITGDELVPNVADLFPLDIEDSFTSQYRLLLLQRKAVPGGSIGFVSGDQLGDGSGIK
jgi:hypothetical protein